MSNTTLYDRDFYAWANEQAALLRSGRLSQADIGHIAEAIESMGGAVKVPRATRVEKLRRENRETRANQPAENAADAPAQMAVSAGWPLDHLAPDDCGAAS